MENIDKNISEIIANLNSIMETKVKEYIRYFIETLAKSEKYSYLEENSRIKNGYYERDINAKYGNIDELMIHL